VALAVAGLVLALAACGSGSARSTAGVAASGSVTTGPAGQASATTGTAAPSRTTGVDPDAPEANTPGDIPDNQVFVGYTPPGGRFTVRVPEGWARTTNGGAVTFTDKLNSIRMEAVAVAAAPTVASASRTELPAIGVASRGFRPGTVTQVHRAAGTVVLLTYQADSSPDPVTGKVVRDAVERYEFWRAGTTARLTLSGPAGADNVDPWRIVTDSFRWR